MMTAISAGTIRTLLSDSPNGVVLRVKVIADASRSNPYTWPG